MNTETKTFALTLDMVRTIRSHPFEVVDGDTGNVLEVRLENNGLPVDLTGRYVCMVFRSCIILRSPKNPYITAFFKETLFEQYHIVLLISGGFENSN